MRTRTRDHLTAHRPNQHAADRQRLQRRTTRVLLTSQVVAGAGLAAGVTVGALLAEDMLGSTRFSGIPAALFTLGSAGTAYAVGVLSDRSGRRVGLAAGYLAATLGGAGVTVAAALDSVPCCSFSAFSARSRSRSSLDMPSRSPVSTSA